MNDNGGTGGVRVWNAGIRGQKNTPYLGGTRAMSFWRWPGTLKPAAVDRLAAQIDVFPTLAELAGARLSPAVRQPGGEAGRAVAAPGLGGHHRRVAQVAGLHDRRLRQVGAGIRRDRRRPEPAGLRPLLRLQLPARGAQLLP